jgi:chromosome segregation protein
MFRFLEISLHGWDLWPQVRVPLDRDVMLLLGPNGSGKTTFLDAIRQLLAAHKLSSKRRVQSYLRRPDQPALIRAVVSNATAGGGQPFRKERLADAEVTLACALVPSSGGTPEKRYAIRPGRPSAPELQRLLLETNEFYTPERYERALENAGVSRSLMSVLAIEQGRTHSLFELTPRELFRRVLEMLGDKAVLDRYTEARRRFEEAQKEVARQTQGLLQKRAELERVRSEVRRLDEWEEARDKVADLGRRLPAAQYQRDFQERTEAEVKLRELRTKVRQGEARRMGLKLAFEEAQRIAGGAQEELNGVTKAENRATDVLVDGESKARSGREKLDEMERLSARAASLPEADLAQLQASRQRAERVVLDRERRLEESVAVVKDLESRAERARQGVPDYPAGVAAVLSEVGRAGIAATLLCREIGEVGAEVAEALEAALGDARFGLLVEEGAAPAAFEIARSHGFPGPVYAGVRVGEALRKGAVMLGERAPAWIVSFLEQVHLGSDGGFQDSRGRWVGGARERFLGQEGLKATLRRLEQELADAASARDQAVESLATGVEARDRCSAALEQERERRVLLERAAGLEEQRAVVVALETDVAGQRSQLELLRERRVRANSAWLVAQQALQENMSERNTFEGVLKGELAGVTAHERKIVELDEVLQALAAGLDSDLRLRAEEGKLEDGPETVKEDLQRARTRLAALAEPPGADVRLQAKHLEENIQELQKHVGDRSREAEHADQELRECRARYLEIVSHTLYEYKARAVELARSADISVELDLPQLRNDEQSLDEARIEVRFGFDGKEALPMGDPSFSGGQQVVAGLILLMAMAETEGGGFFMLDEPFAHLSLDRIDQVGRFLRASRAQFLITAPTTLDRAQLDPASMVIVLQKKRKDSSFAPAPMVALA